MDTTNMTPIDWAKRPINKYADFTGRAPRAEFWWFTLAVIIASIIANIFDSIIGSGGLLGGYGLVSLVLSLAVLVPSISVTARRLHDTNRSGWWMLILVVPYILMIVMVGGAAASGSMAGLGAAGLFGFLGLIGAIALLVLMVLPSTPGDNRYGPNPYGEGGIPVAAE